MTTMLYWVPLVALCAMISRAQDRVQPQAATPKTRIEAFE